MIFGTSVSKWAVLVALAALLWVARGVLPPFIVAGILMMFVQDTGREGQKPAAS